MPFPSDNNKFRLSVTLIKREDRKELRELTDKVEQLSEMKGLSDRLEMIISELVNNAVKGNLKRIYFESKGYSFDDQESYRLGLESFKKNYGHLNFSHYEKAMRLLNFKINIEINLSDNYLLLLIENNNMMSTFEEKRIRMRLKEIMEKKMRKENLLDIYLHYGDEIEENTLGLAMIVDFLSGMGYDLSLFRVYNEGNSTKARLEIPLHFSH